MYREYRDHVKDLSCISKDLCRIVIVDNNPFSFLLQPLNGIPCIPFSPGQPHDDQVNILIIRITIKTWNFSLTNIYPMNIWWFLHWWTAPDCPPPTAQAPISAEWRAICALWKIPHAWMVPKAWNPFLPSNTVNYREHWSCHSLYNSSKPENNRYIWQALVSAGDPKVPFSKIQLQHPGPYLWTSTCMCYVVSVHVIFVYILDAHVFFQLLWHYCFINIYSEKKKRLLLGSYCLSSALAICLSIL